MVPGLTFHRTEGAMHVASWRDVFFEVWRKPGAVEDLRIAMRFRREFVDSQPDKKFVSFTVVFAEAVRAIAPDLRNEISTYNSAVDPHVRAACVVIPSGGFAASIIRGVMAGLALVNRPKHPTHSGGDFEAACAFIAPHMRPNGAIAITTRDVRSTLDAVLSPPPPTPR